MKRKTCFAILVVLSLLAVGLLGATQSAVACNQGCTPGFWKNHVSTPPWPAGVCVDYTPPPNTWHFLRGVQNCPNPLIPINANTPVTNLFTGLECLYTGGILDLNDDGQADTLLDALNYQGGSTVAGKAQIMLRIAVAGVLNGMTQDHDPPAVYISHVRSAMLGMDTQWGHVPGGCDGNTGFMLYWATFWDDRVNQQPCVFD